MGQRDFLFIGHRTTGKTTLASEFARRGWHVADLDEAIQKAEGKTPEEIITDGEEHFRRLEKLHLDRLLAMPLDEPRIIVLGAGCMHLPAGPIAVWLRRDDWVRSARLERERLRPEWTFEREVEWMVETREPPWRDRADLVFDLPAGRSTTQSTELLETLLAWVDAGDGEVSRKTWLVAKSASALDHAAALVRRLGLAGIEVRSDLVDPFPDSLDVPVLASLRTDDPDWASTAWDSCGRLDIDLALAGVEQNLPPQADDRLIFSAHPVSDHERTLAKLLDLAESRAAETKFAPAFDDPLRALEIFEQRSRVDTFLLQGLEWAWLRPILTASTNRLNYMAMGLAGQRLGGESVPPMDLRDWLPHLALNSSARFKALIGQPAWKSQGDIWHRRAAMREGKANESYLKIDAPPEQFRSIVGLAATLGVDALSVTAPFKPEAGRLARRDEALNTLAKRDDQWLGTDTDAVGMKAQLEWIGDHFDVERSCALLGKGGVSLAALRGIEAAGWRLEAHRGAREGWTSHQPRVGVLINAAGHWGYRVENQPRAKIWLDLHYASTEAPPIDATHVIGDVFFEAQAAAQREFWKRTQSGDSALPSS